MYWVLCSFSQIHLPCVNLTEVEVLYLSSVQLFFTYVYSAALCRAFSHPKICPSDMSNTLQKILTGPPILSILHRVLKINCKFCHHCITNPVAFP